MPEIEEIMVSPLHNRIDGMCSVCGLRPGTEKWVGEYGMMGLVHGMYTMRCPICVLEEQIEVAKRQAAAIPMMESQLEKLRAAAG